MKKILLYLFLIFFWRELNAQSREKDSLENILATTKTDAIRAGSLDVLGRILMQEDNFSKALQTELGALQLFEKLNDSRGLERTYYDIGNIYERLDDHTQALNNFIHAKDFGLMLNDSSTLVISLSSIGFNYYKLNDLDSALKYAQLTYELSKTKGIASFRLPWALALMGGVQDKMENKSIALAYYREAFAKAVETDQQALLPYLYQVMGVMFKDAKLRDSAIEYGKKAFEASRQIDFTKGILDASNLLADLYSSTDNNQAIFYFKIAAGIRDSIFSADKVKQVQNIRYNEDSRQQEIEKQKEKTEEERKQNIGYAAVGLGLIGLLILFLVLSHTIIVNESIIKFFGTVGLLLVFEFINLLLHPFLERITGHSPLLMLAAMATIAAMLVPVHHSLQKWITQRLVEKNKKIRLIAAKKTIEKLEGKADNISA
jgi:tetratricopeptide (TPR) repeat protein